ncbi:putative protein CXorf58 [Chytriomyces hyalinus]|nr:putative protein CXorf58 [Chytriomyces hyalinus]
MYSLEHDPHHTAARIIARSWRSWKHRTIFTALKAALYKAERSVTMDVMRKLCPREVEYMTDPITQPRVRFRFGGVAFPPTILFKIYAKSANVHYFSGSRLIESGSQAARDACRMMGTRTFTQHLIHKAAYNHSRTIADPVDVTNRLEYVKYMNEMDQLAPQWGGRNNGWRELSFSCFSSQATVYDNNMESSSFNISRRQTIFAKRASSKAKPRTQRIHRDGVAAESIQSQLQSHENAQFLQHRELEDDFVNLFEWTTNLHVGDLEDYIAI